MASSIEKTIINANKNNVEYLLTISTEDSSFYKILDIINKHQCVYGTYGIHPHEAKKHKQINTEKIIENVKKNNKIIGIGETGLDFYYNHSEKKTKLNYLMNIFLHQNL